MAKIQPRSRKFKARRRTLKIGGDRINTFVGGERLTAQASTIAKNLQAGSILGLAGGSNPQHLALMLEVDPTFQRLRALYLRSVQAMAERWRLEASEALISEELIEKGRAYKRMRYLEDLAGRVLVGHGLRHDPAA